MKDKKLLDLKQEKLRRHLRDEEALYELSLKIKSLSREVTQMKEILLKVLSLLD